MILKEHNPEWIEPEHPLPALRTDAPEFREVADASAEDAMPQVRVPAPMWLLVLGACLLFWAGLYLAFYSGGFRSTVFDETAIAYGPGAVAHSASAAKKAGAASAEASAAAEDPVALGKRFFSANCIACHQGNGQGVAGQYPPLVGSDWVNGSTKPLAAIVLYGIQGPIQVHGTTYNGQMPAWGPVLTDKKIACILTYIRQEWGNKSGPVTTEEVGAIRKEFASRTTPWTEPELKALK